MRAFCYVQAVLKSFNFARDSTDAMVLDFARGQVGARLHPLDEAALKLNPSRVFIENELVAYEDAGAVVPEEAGDGGAGSVYRYGRVVNQTFDNSLGLGLSRVKIQVGKATGVEGSGHKEVLSSEVWTFKAVDIRAQSQTTVVGIPVERKSRQKHQGSSNGGGGSGKGGGSDTSKASRGGGGSKSEAGTANRNPALAAVQSLLSKVGIAVQGESLALVHPHVAVHFLIFCLYCVCPCRYNIPLCDVLPVVYDLFVSLLLYSLKGS